MANPSAELKPGVIIGGWKLEKQIGSGAFGMVFQGKLA